MFVLSCTITWPNSFSYQPLLETVTKTIPETVGYVTEILLSSYVYNVTNFEVCGFAKNKKNPKYLDKETIFFLQMKKLIEDFLVNTLNSVRHFSSIKQ